MSAWPGPRSPSSRSWCAAGAAVYLRDIGHAYERLSGSRTAPWSGGLVGSRKAVTGRRCSSSRQRRRVRPGPADRQAVLGPGWHWIAPSRILRSSLPEGSTFDDQARAYAELLVTSASPASASSRCHRAASALLFALYPDRVSSLTLVSCGVAPGRCGCRPAPTPAAPRSSRCSTVTFCTGPTLKPLVARAPDAPDGRESDGWSWFDARPARDRRARDRRNEPGRAALRRRVRPPGGASRRASSPSACRR